MPKQIKAQGVSDMCSVSLLWVFATLMDEVAGWCCDVLLGEGRCF